MSESSFSVGLFSSCLKDFRADLSTIFWKVSMFENFLETRFGKLFIG